MTLDIFGNTLYTGDVVVFADVESGEPTLSVFELEEFIDTNVALATCMSGDDIGKIFYLQDMDLRCSLVRNVNKAAGFKRNSTIN